MEQREIKFRVWDNKNNIMINNIQSLSYPHSGIDFDWFLNRSGFPIMQYTGLKDKNGKDIYVGDIVSLDTFDYKDRVTTEVGVCRYNDVWGVFMFHTGEDISEAFTFFSIGCLTENSTVLGNINENKELLE